VVLFIAPLSKARTGSPQVPPILSTFLILRQLLCAVHTLFVFVLSRRRFLLWLWPEPFFSHFLFLFLVCLVVDFSCGFGHS
jgi:hypothetical protein